MPLLKTLSLSLMVLTVLPCEITLGAISEAYRDPRLIQSGLFTGATALILATFNTR